MSGTRFQVYIAQLAAGEVPGSGDRIPALQDGQVVAIDGADIGSGGGGGPVAAEDVSFNDTVAALDETDVQGALEALKALIDGTEGASLGVFLTYDDGWPDPALLELPEDWVVVGVNETDDTLPAVDAGYRWCIVNVG